MSESSITVQGVPASVTREQVCDLMRGLGVEPNEVAALTMHPDGIEITVYASRRPGDLPAYRWVHNATLGEAATHRLTIPILEKDETP